MRNIFSRDIHKTVSFSNNNLRTACKQLGVRHVDNTPTFTAPSGAPKLILYKDPFHPSRKGTARLAENLFGSTSNNKQTGPSNMASHYNFPPLQTGPTRPQTLTGHNTQPRGNPSSPPLSIAQSPSFSQPPPGYCLQHHSGQQPVSLQSSGTTDNPRGTEATVRDNYFPLSFFLPPPPSFIPSHRPPPRPCFAHPSFNPNFPPVQDRGPVPFWGPGYGSNMMWPPYPPQQVAAY